MGFGSYDEAEQDNQEIDTDYEDDEAVNTAEHDHEGEVSYEFSDASNDELLDQLEEIKDQGS